MATKNASKATLLGLPSEIRLLIWEHVFGNADIKLYCHMTPAGPFFWNDCPDCEECMKTNYDTGYESSSFFTSTEVHDRITRGYKEKLESLLICRTIYSEAIDIFLSTLTIHAKSSETLAFIRSSAPPQVRAKITRLVLYLHLQNQNNMSWYMRLVELNQILPGLQHVAINYHMHAPASYNELGDAIYMTMPLLALNPPFNKPLYIVTEQNRSEKCIRQVDGKTIPCTDPKPGLSIHTAYKKHDILFSSAFLGDVTTDDVIDEHTSVIRALFEDETYVSAAKFFLASDIYHQPWRKYRAYKIPRAEVPSELINSTGGRELLDALVQVSRRFEKPWFEKLQKRRMVNLYMHHGEMTREEAEAQIDQQLAGLGEDGIATLWERLLDDAGELQITF